MQKLNYRGSEVEIVSTLKRKRRWKEWTNKVVCLTLE